MKKLIFLALISGIVCSCNQAKKYRSSLLNPSNLASQFFKIDINHDTTLLTLNGATIRIPKGALSTSSGEIVTIEIKEAYSIEQMLQANLYTQSKGKPLSSGGMIYINATGSQTVKITQAISVSIPTPFIEKDMQLFKGEIGSDSNINWVDPKPMPESPYQLAVDSGEILFKSLACNACHAIGKELTGPDLAHVVKRSPNYPSADTINRHNLLYEFTRNNQAVLESGNLYYNWLFCKWNRIPMNAYPSLTDAQLKQLYDYIENESERKNLPIPKNEFLPDIDSCETYYRVKQELLKEKARLSKVTVPMIVEKITNERTARGLAWNAEPGTMPGKVNPGNPRSLYYQFTIEAFGWYNVDLLLEEKYGSVTSELRVRVMGEYRTTFSLYLLIPSTKTLGPGGLLDNEENVYGFYTTDGTIPLPQGVQAYVLGIGEEQDEISYGYSQFTTKTKNDIQIYLETISIDAFNKQMKRWNFDSLSIQVNNTKVGDTLRKIDKGLRDAESLKPKNFNCDCMIREEGYPDYLTAPTAFPASN